MLKETIRIMRRELLPDGTKRNAGIDEVTAAEAADLVDAGQANYIDAPAKPAKPLEPTTVDEQPAEEDLNNGR